MPQAAPKSVALHLSLRTAVLPMSHMHVPQLGCWWLPQWLGTEAAERPSTFRVVRTSLLPSQSSDYRFLCPCRSYKLPRYPWFDIWILVPCATLVVLGIKTSLFASILVLDMLWDSARLLWHGL